MRTLTLSAIFLATAALAADPVPKPIPGLKAAQDAYDKELLIAKELHSRTVKEARAEYVKALKVIQTERTKAGDLDGAIEVKEMIAGVEGEAERHPVGTWRVTYAPGDTSREYVVDSKGRISLPNERLAGTMKLIGTGVYLVDLGDGKLERFTAVRDYFLVEHFNPKSSYAEGRGLVNRYGIAAIKK